MPVGAYAVPLEEEGRYRLITSRAESWDQSPVGVTVESRHPETMAATAVQRIKRHCTATSIRQPGSDPRIIFATHTGSPSIHGRWPGIN